MLILASASPRRRELLELITTEFTVITSDVDETLPPGTHPRKTVEELALRKAKAVARNHPEDTVIGADTVVVLEDAILGKPQDSRDARRMLKQLSGRQHLVYTGVAVLSPREVQVFSEETQVRFLPLTDRQIDMYIETGEPFDKAGAYGIQGRGALFITGIQGDYYNVMGLPICKLALALFPEQGNGNNL